VAADLRGDVGGEGRPGVVHGQEHAGELQARVEVVAYEVDGRQELAEALQGVVLALDRDKNAVCGRERIHREKAHRRRAVEQDEVELLADVREGLLEPSLALADRDELHLGTREIDSRGDHP
jgi:hypothetical protein